MATCKKCGATLKDGAKFCSSCGVKAPARAKSGVQAEAGSAAGGAGAPTDTRGVGGGLLTAFVRPYLDFIDRGKLYGFIYVVMAIINALFPFVVIYLAIATGFLKLATTAGARIVIVFVFIWLVIAFACWVGFQLWIARRARIAALAATEFAATPIFPEILQTFGEWAGTSIAIVGTGVGLMSLFLQAEASRLIRATGLGFIRVEAMSIIVQPAIGFFIIILSRFLAEQLRIFASLANNTKEIAEGVKGKR